jgi:dipeptidyl aminopeptidase/acylaminoacyl peptidase
MKDEPWDSPLPPFGGSSQIAWAADGKALAYVAKKLVGREWTISTNSDIYLYDLASGQTRNLTAFNEGYDKNPVFSPDGRYMAWESMATPGFESDKSRIMIMDMETGKYRDYSAGFDQSSSGFAWSADSRTLYFVSGIHATYQLYALDLETAEVTQVTEGDHDYQSVAPAGEHLIAERMSISMPTEIFRVDPKNGAQEQISFVNGEILARTAMGRVEERWVKTTDDKDMLVWVIYPPNFDSDKEYPALLYCGGGPQSAVSQFFSYRWNFQIMAANDYIVVAPNRRGLPTFGQEWNDQISLDYGGQNMKDYLSAIDAVKAEPFVDENRLGAVGASYGGYSVFWLAGNHDGRFSAFISHCGLFNLESWYATTEEMFFANHDIGGAYWEEPRPHSYDFSPHLHVHKWDAPMMVIHGARDFRVPYGEGLQAFNIARLQGLPARLLFFPEESHWVLSAQNGIVWQREFFKWLDEWLK